MTKVNFKKADVDGFKVFYREAGAKDKPTILLLHGFPTSSHMFRDLIPLLADRFHVVAPDLPGFGQSDMPARDKLHLHVRQYRCRSSTASPKSSDSTVSRSTSSTTARRRAFASRCGTPSASPRSSRRTATPMRRA